MVRLSAPFSRLPAKISRAPFNGSLLSRGNDSGGYISPEERSSFRQHAARNQGHLRCALLCGRTHVSRLQLRGLPKSMIIVGEGLEAYSDSESVYRHHELHRLANFIRSLYAKDLASDDAG
jgi:hypothetical protein